MRIRGLGALILLTSLLWGCGGDTPEPLPLENQGQDAQVTVEILQGPDESTAESRAEFEIGCAPEGCALECRLQDEEFRSCQSPVVYEDLEEGEYRFEARALFGETYSDLATWEWQIEDRTPEVLDLEGPPPLTASTSATFTFRCSEENCEFLCSLNQEAFQACDSGVTYTGLGSTTHQFQVRPRLLTGQTGPVATWEWEVDPEVPEVVDLEGPELRTRAGDAQFDFQCSQENCTYHCQLNQQDWEACVSGVQYLDLDDGHQIFSVRAENQLGVQGPASSLEWIIDRELPQIVELEGPEELTAQDLASFSFSCSKQECQFFCRLNDGDFLDCVSGVTFEDLVDGEQVFSVYASDDLGNQGEEVHYEWTVFGEEPEVELTATPLLSSAPGYEESTSAAEVSFEFQCSQEECQFQCRLNDGTFEDCMSGVTYDLGSLGAASGPHLFEVRARSVTGVVGPAKSFAWSIDRVAPVITWTILPENPTNSDTATFEFQCSKPGCLYTCALNGVALQDCQSGVTVTSLVEGANIFAITAEDPLNNSGEEEVFTWIVDRELPEVVNLDGPMGVTSSTVTSFTFQCSKSDCIFECALNQGDFQSCVSGETYTDLDDGDQHFALRAIDALGNVGEVTTREWTVLSEAPAILGLQGPELSEIPGAEGMTASTSATFEWSCSQEECTFECSFNQGGYASCEPGVQFDDLIDGEQVLSLRPISQAGVIGSSLSFEWEIDRTAPVVTFDDGPALMTNQLEATLEWSCSKTPCFSQCSLNSEPFQSCSSPLLVDELAAGTQTLIVEATDGVGNTSNEVEYTWEIDLVVPEVENLTGPPALSNQESVTFEFQCSKDCTFQCVLESESDGVVQDIEECATGVTYSIGADGEYLFTVLATDSAGNTSDPLSFEFEIDRVAPEIVNLSGPPSEIDTLDVEISFECSKSPCETYCTLFAGTDVLEAEASCSSPTQFFDLAEGDYTFAVYAIDEVGNQSTESTLDWTIAIPEPAASLAMGFEHTCYVDEEGRLFCWGTGMDGRLGTGTEEEVIIPEEIWPGTSWVDAASGEEHSCAIREDQTLWCWGNGDDGRLGLGNDDTYLTPQQVLADDPDMADGWAEISLGIRFSCALRTEGSAWCWGRGRYGVLGLDSTANFDEPQEVLTNLGDHPGSWKQISTTREHVCGIASDDTLWCWGRGSSGRLGLGSNSNSLRPAKVVLPEEKTWSRVAAGSSTTCGVQEDSSLWCWGAGSFGQLGRGSIIGSNQPRLVAQGNPDLEAGWKDIAVGGHVCGLREDSTLYCWGSNRLGQLGLAVREVIETTPQQVALDDPLLKTGWKGVAIGLVSTCGIHDEGLFCWGRNTTNSLGVDSAGGGAKTYPFPVDSSLSLAAGARGSNHSCAISAEGHLLCWGSGGDYQLGSGQPLPERRPVEISTPGEDDQGWTDISAGHLFSCGVNQGGLFCWGWGTSGQLGHGNASTRTTPSKIAGFDDHWTQVSSGRFSSCALKTNGTLWCWGAGLSGQLGTGVNQSANTPQQVFPGDPLETGWEQIDSGGSVSCAIREDSTLWCWGGSSLALGLGNQTSNVNEPTQVLATNPLLSSGWSQVSTGGGHSCAIREDSTLWCWGTNSNGRLGLGNQGDQGQPTQVMAGDPQMAQGWAHVSLGAMSCAIREDQSLWCWGRGRFGNFGFQDVADRDLPEQIGTGMNWIGVALGGNGGTAWTADGEAYSWGLNEEGRLGDGRAWVSEPLPVLLP